MGKGGVQGDMEGVRQQAEQHLAAAHAEARSTIQKAQTTAADLQVTSFAVAACSTWPRSSAHLAYFSKTQGCSTAVAACS